MDKNADLTLNVSTTSTQSTLTNIRFSTQDEGSAKLTFFLFKDGVELPLNAVVGKLVMRMRDGSKFTDNVSIIDKVNGIAEYKLTAEQLKHYGKVTAELYLYYEEQKLSVHRFTFTILQALIDEDIPVLTEFYIDDFEELKATINSMADETTEIINTVGINVEEAKGKADEAITLIEQNQVVKLTEFNENKQQVTAQLATKAEQEKVDLSWVYVNNQTSLVNALAYSKRVKLISGITITAPITLLEGTHIHFNGYIIHSNHEGKAINDVTGCYFYHLNVYSNFGVKGDYMPNNICVVATDSVFYNPVIKSFGTDALVLNGGCTVDLLETDDIRDNPIVLYGENNFVNCVNCGTCGGDFILIKGNKNMVLKGKCNIAGYRENTTNFTAGSGIVIGADGTAADDNYVGDIEINYWGANLFNIDGNRNYINSIKAISSLYDDTYPVANSTNLVRAGLIAKNYNKVGIITIETTPRVIGIAGSNNTVEIMDIGTVTKQGMLSIESSSYESNRIGKLIIEKILTGGDSFRIYGNKTKFDEILVDSISGGGTDHFKCYGDQVRIGTLKIFGDETTTTGNFGILSSQNAEIDSLTVWGYNGYTLNVIKKCFLAKLNLRNNTISYDNILIINVTDGSKFAINGSSISDRTGGARRTKIKGNANVIFTNNLAADPVNEGTGQLVVSNNI